jgi:hypothetical protein
MADDFGNRDAFGPQHHDHGVAMDIRRKQTLWGAVAGGVVATTVALVLILGGPPSLIPHRDSTGARSLLWLYAPRDMGRLPARASWCTLGRSAEHCWLMDQPSGTLTDTGSAATKWHMTAGAGTRRSVATGVPVATSATTWDATSELGVGTDQVSGAGLSRATTTTDASNVLSVSFAFSAPHAGPGYTGQHLIYHQGTTSGFEVYITTSGSSATITAYLDGGAPTKYLNSIAAPISDGAPHCVTVVIDARTLNAFRVYVDGLDYTPEEHNATSVVSFAPNGTPTFYLYRNGNGLYSLAGVGGRARYDVAALTYDQHRSICGTAWDAPEGGDTKIAPGDDYYAQTVAAARCYASSATTATCAPTAAPWYAWDRSTSSTRWPVEPARTNRLKWSMGASCARWTCSTATMANTVSPAGTNWATAITMGGGYAQTEQASAYTAAAPLYHRVWMKASSGTIDASNVGGEGHWTIDGTTLGGVWTELYTGHPAVTEIQPWKATGAGAVVYRVSGANVSIWGATLTEVAGLSVIPTAAAAQSTAAPRWSVDDIADSYYPAGSAVTQSLTTLSGTCLAESGTDILLSGSSTCTGYWSELKIVGKPAASDGTYGTSGRVELYVLAGQSNAEGREAIANLDATLLGVPAGVDYFHNASAQSTTLTNYADFSTAILFGTYRFGAAPMLANRLAAQRPKKRVVIAHMGLGGTSLYAAWQPYDWDAVRGAVIGEAAGVYQWSTVTSRIRSAIGRRKARFVAAYWMQGEQDCLSDVAAADYATGLALLQSALAAEYGAPERFVIARVRCEAGDTGRAVVRAAQESFPYWFNVDDLPLLDTVHFNEAGYYTLGIRFAGYYNPNP